MPRRDGAASFSDVVAYPEHGYTSVATRDHDPDLLAKGGDPGIIARFETPDPADGLDRNQKTYSGLVGVVDETE